MRTFLGSQKFGPYALGRRVLLASTLLAASFSALAQNSKDQDQAAIEQLVSQYRKSIDDLDMQLASQIWLTTADATFIHPRGHERGWEAITRNFYQGTMGARFSSRKLQVRDVHVSVTGDSAYAEFYWNFEAIMRSDGSTLRTAGRESQMFLRTPGGWRLAHIHYSSMPVTGERQGF